MYKILQKTKEVLLISGALVAMIFATSFVSAGEGYRGLSIGIIGSNSTVDTSGYELERGRAALGLGNDPEDKNSTSISTDVSFPSLFIEYSWGETLAMTIGAEYIPGEHNIGTKTRTDSAVATAKGGAENDTGTRTGSASIRDLVTLYFEPGIMFNDNVGIYAKAGAMGMQLEALETNLPNSQYGIKDVWGAMYGVGMKYVTSYGIFLKLEGTKVEFPTIEWQSGNGNNNIISAEPDMTSARFAIGYNF